MRFYTSLLVLVFIFLLSCSKSPDPGTGPTPPACVVFNLTTSVNNTSPCPNASGAITVTATGSQGFTYSLDSGQYQTANAFTNLGAGQYTVRAKDSKGCIQATTAVITVGSAGPLYTAVQSVIQANCAVSGCHTGANPSSGINFSDYCQILSLKARIKIRAVDWANTPNQMPRPPRAALSVADQQKITDWINAGGGYSN